MQLEDATVRFAGDSGDGMQLAGTQLTNTSALAGNDVATFPDFPAEIRAPRGTLAGVSGFQIHFASTEIYTPGDRLNALVAMNPAALKTNLPDLEDHGILIVDKNAFDGKGLKLAHYESDPLEDDSLEDYQLFSVEITMLTREAVKDQGLSQKESDRCRNFFAMGLVYWLYGRSLDPTLRYIDEKFGSKPAIAEANRLALKAGWNYGETTEAFAGSYQVTKADLGPGTYRNITGNQSLAWGMIAAAKLSGKDLFLGSYPITPASDILHELSKFKNFGVRTFQAEDEIAAMTSTIGAAFGGAMSITTSSGPGIALKGEGMGLAMMLELPMLIVNVQRGGPSTGLPTKTEQSDLLQAMFGRNGESPAAGHRGTQPGRLFRCGSRSLERSPAVSWCRSFILSDGYIANGAEPWRIPEIDSLETFTIEHPQAAENGDPFLPYERDEMLARPWAIPGTPGLMHRLGGLEKQDITGNVSYDPLNHQHMTDVRAQKVENIAKTLPPTGSRRPGRGRPVGGELGRHVRFLHHGRTKRARAKGHSVAHVHLRWLNPLPADLGDAAGAATRRCWCPS